MATTYLTTEEAETLLGYEVTEAEILQAESDLDDLALGVVLKMDRSTEAPFRKLNPAKLTPAQEDNLKRATAEQIKYRRLMGEEFFSRPQRDKSSAEGVSVEGRLPHIGERVTAILADAGLINRLGTYSTKPKSDLEDIGWELP
jgi:hypothetical protein